MNAYANPPQPRRKRRRDFLKASAIGIGTVAGLSIVRSAHAAGSDTIRIGMVGCGGRCSGAAMDAMTADPGTRLVAMADLFADRLQNKRELLASGKPDQVTVDDEHCFVGLDAYKQVIDHVDVVLIACAAKFHPMYVKAAVDAGKHVFVEKPHAIDAAGIKYAFCRTTPECYNESSSVILGSNGVAYPLRGRITGSQEWRFSGPQGSPYVAEQAAYLQSIRAGEPLNCGDYMARSTLVAIMGQLSCYSGSEVRWDVVRESNFCLLPKPEDCTWDMQPPTAPDDQGVYPVCATPGVTRCLEVG
jgi:hypothetical protein